MCGILGSINYSFTQTTLDLISHRGPDSSGIFDIRSGSHDIMFGHRRLSIVDLTPAGNQPMISEDGNFIIIFNGEIYNHNELRISLQGQCFKGTSDTETILYYIAKHGIKSIEDFNGIFSLAIFDKCNEKLYIARDPFGVKPLYYFSNENEFVFSSEIRPVKQLLGSTSLDKESLVNLLKFRFSPSPETLHSEIKKVGPGEIIQIDLSQPKLTYRFIRFLKGTSDYLSIDFDSSVIKYGEIIRSAVTRQLMSDVEVGVLLSGGVDSAIVAKIAQEHSNTKLKAFTIGFEGNHIADEIRDASETAALLGLEHFYQRIGFNDFLNVLQKCSAIVEEPIATTSFIPMYYLSALASEHVKVVLTGQGADEPLGGYMRYRGELLNEKAPKWLIKTLLGGLSTLNLKNETLIRSIGSLGEQDEIKRFEKIYSLFNNAEILSLTGFETSSLISPIQELYNILSCKNQKSSVERMMSIDSRLNLSDDLLLYTDKITMNFSLECRVPFLDLELVKFIESLPVKYRVNLLEGKIIHKRFAENFLPKNIVYRKKKGFYSPTNVWFKQEMNTIRDLLVDNNSPFSLHIDTKTVNRILNQHIEGFNKEKQIFLLLSLYFWFHENNSVIT